MRIDLEHNLDVRKEVGFADLNQLISLFGELMYSSLGNELVTFNDDVVTYSQHQHYLLEPRSNSKIHVIDDLSRYRINRALREYSILAIEIPELKILKEISEVIDYSVTAIENVLYLRIFLIDTFFTFRLKVFSPDNDIMNTYFRALRSRKPMGLAIIDTGKEVGGSYTEVVECVASEVNDGAIHRVEVTRNPKGYGKLDSELVNAMPSV
ncbi:hypothetical protein AB4455_23050 [Vibrio sp. 10N.261.46.E12]|uniref:hypothetical protein n=1 Tax=unclassified Vibrio TaxID=2614977 RepID=UPI000C81A474|nr:MULTISPECIES: hypothetical protein [unclassified Vibrio]PML84190.1 hypothetical protein BCT66_17960 [Vibrio sp. 10N.261.49.E11]PMN44192.1 hypothetical protein BCT32_15760 [Vibrio sp. 10N.261.45.E11]PMN78897.1 hypothetical protein BCT22_18310 [Vibrio sp. 10N.261.45.A1]